MSYDTPEKGIIRDIWHTIDNQAVEKGTQEKATVSFKENDVVTNKLELDGGERLEIYNNSKKAYIHRHPSGFLSIEDRQREKGGWPQIGDEVMMVAIEQTEDEDKKGTLLALTEEHAIVLCDKTEWVFTLKYCSIEKPPALEEKIADILTEITGYQDRQAVLKGARTILLGEANGLIYEEGK